MNKENVCKTFCVVASSPSTSLSIFLPTPPLSYFQVREESEQRESAISPSEMENQTGFRKSGEIAYKALNNEFRMRKPVTTGRDCVLLFASVTPLDVFKQTGCFLRDAGTFLAVFLAKLLIFLTRTLFLVTKTGYFSQDTGAFRDVFVASETRNISPEFGSIFSHGCGDKTVCFKCDLSHERVLQKHIVSTCIVVMWVGEAGPLTVDLLVPNTVADKENEPTTLYRASITLEHQISVSTL